MSKTGKETVKVDQSGPYPESGFKALITANTLGLQGKKVTQVEYCTDKHVYTLHWEQEPKPTISVITTPVRRF